MTPLNDLTDDEIQVKAIVWRGKALQGNQKALGMAHMYEAESRRRAKSNGVGGFDALDIKPVPARGSDHQGDRRTAPTDSAFTTRS
ncbi:MAG: hypothetical protein JWQ73_2616 [Variovorax sp.]|jgi:hypothetical protein|nr:hypothetical protein [Variovorax sp.]